MGRVASLILFLVVVLALLGAINGPPAYATTCADYPNQASAQHSRDTRDADGDGLYCESLPNSPSVSARTRGAMTPPRR